MSIDFDDLLDGTEDEQDRPLNDSTAGVATYLTYISVDEAFFETAILPIGEGVAMRRKLGYQSTPTASVTVSKPSRFSNSTSPRLMRRAVDGPP